MGWRNCLKKNTKLEKRLILSVAVLCALVLILFIVLVSGHVPDICDNPECVRAATHILDTVDPTADPCHDFYQFACGTFLKNAFSLGQPTTLHGLQTLMKNKLKEIVVENEDKRNLSRALAMQRKFYKICTNDTIIEENNDRTLLKLLDEVTGGWPVVKGGNWNGGEFNWTSIMIKARKLGFFYQFYFSVGVYSGNTTNMLWIKPPHENDVKSFQWRDENRQLMTQIASNLGARSIDTFREIGRTLDFAEQLYLITQKYYNNTAENEQYVRRESTIRDLRHNRIDINWLDFLRKLTDVKINEDDMVVFDVDDYFTDLYHLLFKTPRKIQANYMAWAIISTNIHYMTKKIRDNYRKMRKFTNGTTPLTRSDLCYKISKQLFKNVAEGEYVRRYTPPSKKEYVTGMVKNIKSELELAMEETSWMDTETKSNAKLHLKTITEAVGWTKLVYDVQEYEKLFGYHRIKMASDKLVDMARLMNINEVNRYYHKLRRPDLEEQEEFINTPKLDVNAFYLSYFDTLILPTPILQEVVVDERRPDYMNYGSLGSIIGHEFMHGIIEYTPSEELVVDDETWWTNKTLKDFKKASRCIIDDYDRFIKNDSLKNDTVFEENLADFSAVNLAYTAYKKLTRRNTLGQKLPGIKYTSDQLFWIMTSTYLCYEPKLTDNDEFKRTEEMHGIRNYRVVGRLQNSPYFAKAFNCPVGSPMNPEKKCRIFA